MNNRAYRIHKLNERCFELVLAGHPDDGYLSSGGFRHAGHYWTTEDALAAGNKFVETGEVDVSKSVMAGYPMPH